MDGILYGFSVALSFENILFVCLGVLTGTVVGLLPGLGPTAAIALLLPLTYTLSPTTAVIFLAGIYYGSMFGGRIPAILLNLPGDGASVVTAFDGYPLRLQGRAGAALGITAIGSFLGGSVSIIGLTLFAPLLAAWAVGIGPAEMFSLTLFGLIMIALIAAEGIIRGMLGAGLGILIATIGLDHITGAQRFTFGSLDLMDGVGIVPLAVGLFGLGELLVDAERRFLRGGLGRVGKIWPTFRDFLDTRWAVMRASVLGFLLGIIPGGGGAMSSVVAYGVEKRFSPHPEKFGHGAIDGLAATETADNASSNAAFIPLLTLGIPPNPVLALIAGALILHGITPGPQLINNSPDLFWGVIASMYIGSVVLLVLNLPMIGIFVQILKVPAPILVSMIVCVAIAGVYSVRNNVFDVYLMFGFAVLGYLLKKVEIPPGPLILGFILAPIMEAQFRRSMLISGGSFRIFVERPVSLAFLILALLLVLSLVAPTAIQRVKRMGLVGLMR
jgi:putative tricarboxylic transport membrane protein